MAFLAGRVLPDRLTTMSKSSGKAGEEAVQKAIAEGLASLHNYTDEALGKLDDRMSEVRGLQAKGTIF